jgi:hypothetical protein
MPSPGSGISLGDHQVYDFDLTDSVGSLKSNPALQLGIDHRPKAGSFGTCLCGRRDDEGGNDAATLASWPYPTGRVG